MREARGSAPGWVRLWWRNQVACRLVYCPVFQHRTLPAPPPAAWTPRRCASNSGTPCARIAGRAGSRPSAPPAPAPPPTRAAGQHGVEPGGDGGAQRLARRVQQDGGEVPWGGSGMRALPLPGGQPLPRPGPDLPGPGQPLAVAGAERSGRCRVRGGQQRMQRRCAALPPAAPAPPPAPRPAPAAAPTAPRSATGNRARSRRRGSAAAPPPARPPSPPAPAPATRRRWPPPPLGAPHRGGAAPPPPPPASAAPSAPAIRHRAAWNWR